MTRLPLGLLLGCTLLVNLSAVVAQEDTGTGGGARGSIVEDRAARKLIEAGDARMEGEEASKAVEIWKSVIERYPRSRVRFDAHMRLGQFFLTRERSYDRARTHFEAAASEDNSDDEQRPKALLNVGVCYYEARNFGKCFQVMRDVVEKFPVSVQVNEAYYYIGLAHFQLQHYSRAITALEKVGTTLNSDTAQGKKLEAGKRFFIKIDDADLAVLDAGQAVDVKCISTSGDEELAKCFPVGRNVRLVLGSIATRLGRPVKGNGILEVKGGDSIKVTYTDEHTADKKTNNPVVHEVTVVGNAIVAVTDGAYSETLKGVVLDKTVNIRVIDGDRDTSDAADQLTAVVEVHRPKTDDEVEAEIIAAKGVDASKATITDEERAKIERFRVVDKVLVTLTEAKIAGYLPSDNSALPTAADVPGAAKTGDSKTDAATPVSEPKDGEEKERPAGEKKPVDDSSIHSGVFHAAVSLVKADMIVDGDDTLQALPGDQIRVKYQDDLSMKEEPRAVVSIAKCLEGNIGGVRVTKAMISDQELRIRTNLRTAAALTNIGNRYKEFGLRDKAEEKYAQALATCEDSMDEARKLKGAFLEETYVQLWHIYFEQDNLNLAAAMCQRLQTEFPNSGFVDDALLQLGDVARKQNNMNRAISIYTRIVNMKTSTLRGEAQFGLAECYEQQATAAKEGPQQTQLQDLAFQEYKKVYDLFPESGRVGEAVAKMANFYYQRKDYARAIDVFETVLSNHPDAKFLDVILFNYGRCLYRMERRPEAKRRFDQLIGEFPESPLATDAKKISEALAKAGF